MMRDSLAPVDMSRKPYRGQVWHYTSTEGLLGILKHGRLWASSAAYMNDAMEMQTGQEALAAAFRANKPALDKWQIDQLIAIGITARPDIRRNFLLSGSREGDLLTLWRNYGGGTVAYSVRLDESVELKPIAQVPGEGHPSPPGRYYEDAIIDLGNGEFASEWPDSPYVFGGAWQKVQYISGPQSKPVAKEYSRLLQNLAEPSPTSFVIPFLHTSFVTSPTNFWKDVGFQDEREVRTAWSVNPTWRFVKYRAERFGTVPYIEVADGSQTSQPFIEHGIDTRLPIREIRIGPSSTGRELADTLHDILTDYGYDVEVTQSVTPYR